MKTSFVSRSIMFLIAASFVACLDLTPTVVATTEDEAGTGTSQVCMDCLTGPSSSTGCADELAACEKDTLCGRGVECTFREGCYSASDDVQPICTRHCADLAGFLSQGDPSTLLALAWYRCALDKCRKTCVGGDDGGTTSDASVADTGARDGGGADAEGGTLVGACTDPTDMAVAADPAFASAPRDCGFMCFGNPDMTCSATCMQGKGLTQPCASCWGDTINCGAMYCLTVCFDATSQACLDCTAQHCDPAFHACSGT
jgi:hypothetical protein